MQTNWIIEGKKADAHALVAHLASARAAKGQRLREIRAVILAEHQNSLETRALNKATKQRLREQDQEAAALDAELKRVGRASRKQSREMSQPVLAYTRPIAPRASAAVDIRLFDKMVHMGSSKSSAGLSSFHCKFTSRGLGDRRANRSRVYKIGEAVRHFQYISREPAREIMGGGLVSNVSNDAGDLTSFFAALEDLEMHDRSNANVYMSLVVSLPHELTPGGRVMALKEICSLLGKHDLPHVGVLHAPDPKGDQRNFHTHIMFSLRPGRMESKGSFAFSADKHSDLNDENFIRPFRREVSAILNTAMERQGAARRFTPLRNEERGLPAKAKGSGKSTPGKKHWERKQAQLASWQREKAMREERELVLAKIRKTVSTILQFPVINRSKIIEQYRLSVPAVVNRKLSEMRSAADAHSVAIQRLSGAKVLAASDELQRLGTRFDRAIDTVRSALHEREEMKRLRFRDPARRQAIANAAWKYRRSGHPPIIKSGAGFAIAPDYAAQYLNEDRFEAEPIIQKIHARHWEATLAKIKQTIQSADRCPVVDGPRGLAIEKGLLKGNLRAAYLKAYPSADIHALLYEMRRDWRIREDEARKEAALKAKARMANKALLRSRVQQLVSEIRERIDSERWPASTYEGIRMPVNNLTEAVANHDLIVRRSDCGFNLFAASEGLYQDASQLSRTKIGRSILRALAAITDDQTIETTDVPRPFVVAQEAEPTITPSAPEVDIQQWHRRDGWER